MLIGDMSACVFHRTTRCAREAKRNIILSRIPEPATGAKTKPQKTKQKPNRPAEEAQPNRQPNNQTNQTDRQKHKVLEFCTELRIALPFFVLCGRKRSSF